MPSSFAELLEAVVNNPQIILIGLLAAAVPAIMILSAALELIRLRRNR